MSNTHPNHTKIHTPADGQNVTNKDQSAPALPSWVVIVLLLCKDLVKSCLNKSNLYVIRKTCLSGLSKWKWMWAAQRPLPSSNKSFLKARCIVTSMSPVFSFDYTESYITEQVRKRMLQQDQAGLVRQRLHETETNAVEKYCYSSSLRQNFNLCDWERVWGYVAHTHM